MQPSPSASTAFRKVCSTRYDPVFYAKPWRGETTWPEDGAKIYEYACNEGNYAMAGILRGARVQEAHGITPKERGGE